MNESQKILSVSLLCVANILNYVDRVLLQAILTDVKTYFSMHHADAGLFQLVFYLSFVASSLVYGALGDFYSRKNLVVFGIVIWSLSEILGSVVPKTMLWAFFVTRVLFGIGQSAITHLGIVMIADMYPEEKRNRCNGFFMAGIPLGSGLGFIIARKIATSTGDWRWAFRITPTLGLAIAFVMAIFTREPTRIIMKDDDSENVEFDEKIEENKQETLKTEQKILYSENIELFEQKMLDETEIPKTKKKLKPTLVSILPIFSFKTLIKDALKYFWMKKSFITNTAAYTFMNFSFGALAFWMPSYLEGLQDNLPGIPGYIGDKNNIGLIFGIVVCVAGFMGVLVPTGLVTCFLKPHRPIELFVCIISSIFASITLFFALLMSLKNFSTMWFLMFCSLFFFSAIWQPHSNMIMNLMGPLFRARASAFESFFIHACGDALSPVIIGAIMDKLLSSHMANTSSAAMYLSFFICPFFTILGGIMYCISMLYYIKDKKATDIEVGSEDSSIEEKSQCLLPSKTKGELFKGDFVENATLEDDISIDISPSGLDSPIIKK